MPHSNLDFDPSELDGTNFDWEQGVNSAEAYQGQPITFGNFATNHSHDAVLAMDMSGDNVPDNHDVSSGRGGFSDCTV